MADYSDSKTGIAGVFPENVLEASYGHLEPLIGVEELTRRHLFGIPLVSQMKGVDGKPIHMTPEMVKDIIDGAVQQAESDCKIDIFPVKRRVKQAFDKNAYESYGFIKYPFRPITSIDKLSITPANGQDVYTVPLEWVETAYCVRGQINIIPMTAAFLQSGSVPQQSAGGAMFLAILGNRAWVPAYWQLECTSGFPDGLIPRVVNELIGTIAAMEILSMLATTYARSQSHSLGIDGLSQSVSTPGPQIFKNRYEELQEKRKHLEKKIRNLFGQGIFSSHV